MTAAKTALKRKKQHEHSLEQTQAQIGTLEQQINAIESANINKETLLAMEKASEAMKQIHGKLTVDKVDETMYAGPSTPPRFLSTTCIVWQVWLNTTTIQGQITRSKRAQRRDRQRHHEQPDRRAHRRRRARGAARRVTAGAAGRADAQDWNSAGVGSDPAGPRRASRQ